MARVTGALSLALAVALAGCSAKSLTTNIFGGEVSLTGNSNSAAGVSNASLDDEDLPCPDVRIRNGAATLTIGSKPGAGEPAPLDVRYQGTIINMARECHLNAGLFTMKVGIEGRVITGPAGGPGEINVPLRIAVVHEGINPVAVYSKLVVVPVTVNNAVDRVDFTHVDPDIAFPAPQPIGTLEHYVVYVGFDPLGAQPQKPKRPERKSKAKAKTAKVKRPPPPRAAAPAPAALAPWPQPQ